MLLQITACQQLTPQLRAYQLVSVAKTPLPIYSPGAQLEFALRATTARYPISSAPAERTYLQICVAQGAQAYTQLQVGMELECAICAPLFQLHAGAAPGIFIAQAEGLAALLPLVQTLLTRGRRTSLHYLAEQPEAMPLLAPLRADFNLRLQLYSAISNDDLAALFSQAASNSQFYVCARQAFIADVSAIAQRLGLSRDQLQMAPLDTPKTTTNHACQIHLQRSQRTINVAPEQPLLHALQMAGIAVKSHCGIGECGTCVQQVLAGEVDHRDEVLSAADHAQGKICICVSRPNGDQLVLDL
jgi:ferredoxin-NADP reductase